MKKTARQLVVALKGTMQKFSRDRCPRMAAALAYYAIFSLAPLLLLLIHLSGYFVDPEDLQGRLTAEMEEVIGREGAEAIQEMMAVRDEPAEGGVGMLMGLAVLIFAATGVVVQLQEALNKAWDMAADPERGGIRTLLFKRLFSFAMILSIGFLLLVSMVLSTVVTSMGEIIEWYLPTFLSQYTLLALNVGLELVIITALFMAVYKILPDARIAWSEVWQGALLTALLFIVGKWGIGWYLGTRDFGSLYGAAGSMVLILIWVYYSSMIVLFGAEFTQVWARVNGKIIRPRKGAVRVISQETYLR